MSSVNPNGNKCEQSIYEYIYVLYYIKMPRAQRLPAGRISNFRTQSVSHKIQISLFLFVAMATTTAASAKRKHVLPMPSATPVLIRHGHTSSSVRGPKQRGYQHLGGIILL
jgi:hypothetical protein